MRPTAKQREVLRRWFAASRYAYNTFVTMVNEKTVTLQVNNRNTVTVVQREIKDKPEVRCLYASMLKLALMQARNAFKTNLAKSASRPFEVHEIPANHAHQVVFLEGANMEKENPDAGPVKRIVAVTRTPEGRRRHANVYLGKDMTEHGPVRIIGSARVIDRLTSERVLQHEGKILWNRHRNHFHLVVCWEADVPAPREPNRVVSLDPGGRHFQVFYDPADGNHTHAPACRWQGVWPRRAAGGGAPPGASGPHADEGAKHPAPVGGTGSSRAANRGPGPAARPDEPPDRRADEGPRRSSRARAVRGPAPRRGTSAVATAALLPAATHAPEHTPEGMLPPVRVDAARPLQRHRLSV